MIENVKVTIKANDKTISFKMTLDSDFVPDRHTKFLIERDGHVEPEVVHLMARVVREGDTVIDGGANVGYFTLLLSQLVGKNGLVFSVEPTPVNIWKLEANLTNNASRNVRVVKSPLYSQVTELEFHMGPDSGLNSLHADPVHVGTMRTISTTIDDILMDEKPRLIKLDVEGAEGLALTGAHYALATCPYVVCKMNQFALERARWSRESLRELMQGYGYELFALHPQGILPTLIPRGTPIRSSTRRDRVQSGHHVVLYETTVTSHGSSLLSCINRSQASARAWRRAYGLAAGTQA